MASNFGYFKHKSTGRIAYLPLSYMNTPLADELEPYKLKDGEFVPCTTCKGATAKPKTSAKTPETEKAEDK